MHGAAGHGSSRRVRTTASAASVSGTAAIDAALEAHYAPTQLFRVPTPGQPLTFACLPRIVLQLVYGYLSLTEIGVACRACRDAHQTAALYRCPLNSERGGIRERWVNLDKAYDWKYTYALSKSPLRLHVTVIAALNPSSGWLSSAKQIRLLRRFKHLEELHMHYSPERPVRWGEELEKLVTRTGGEPTIEELEQDDEEDDDEAKGEKKKDEPSAAAAAAADGDASAAAAASSDSLPPTAPSALPVYARTASTLTVASAQPTPLVSLTLCPIGGHELQDAIYLAEEEARLAREEREKALKSNQMDNSMSRLRKAMSAAASKVGSAIKKTVGSGGAAAAGSSAAAAAADEMETEEQKDGVSSLAAALSHSSAAAAASPAAASSSSASAVSASASASSPGDDVVTATHLSPATAAAHLPVPSGIVPPAHAMEAPSALEVYNSLGKWSEINCDLFSRLGRFTSLEILGLTLLGDPTSWSMAGFKELTLLRRLEIDLQDERGQHLFGRHMVELIEIIRDAPYANLQKLQSNAIKPVHLRQIMRPRRSTRSLNLAAAAGDAGTINSTLATSASAAVSDSFSSLSVRPSTPPPPPVWSSMEELAVTSEAGVPPDYAAMVAEWIEPTIERFWPEDNKTEEEKRKDEGDEAKSPARGAASASSNRRAKRMDPSWVTGDEALQMLLQLPNLRIVDLLSFFPPPSAATLRRLDSLALLDTLALGGALLQPFQAQVLGLGDAQDWEDALNAAGDFAAMRSAMRLDEEIVEALAPVGKSGKIVRLTLAFMVEVLPGEDEAEVLRAAAEAMGGPQQAPQAAAAAAAAAPAAAATTADSAATAEAVSSSSSADPSIPRPFTVLLSHFASLLDLSLEGIFTLTDLSAVVQCTKLETLQLVSLPRLDKHALLALAPLDRLFSVRVSGVRVSRRARKALKVPSTLMPGLREFVTDKHGHHGHGHHHHGHHPPQAAAAAAALGAAGQGQGGVANLLQPALHWLANMLAQAGGGGAGAGAGAANLFAQAQGLQLGAAGGGPGLGGLAGLAGAFAAAPGHGHAHGHHHHGDDDSSSSSSSDDDDDDDDVPDLHDEEEDYADEELE